MSETFAERMDRLEQVAFQRQARDSGELTLIPGLFGGCVVVQGAVYTLGRAPPVILFAGDAASCLAFLADYYREREAA